MLQDAVYRVDRRKPDCKRSEREFALFALFASYFSILPHRYPETAYLYDFSGPEQQIGPFSFSSLFCQVRRHHLLHSTHTHVLVLFTYSILHSLFH